VTKLTWLKPKKLAKEFYFKLIDASLSAGNPKIVIETLRQLCKDDLFFLLAYVLGRRDVDIPPDPKFNPNWCFERCREVQANPDGYIDLWSREHFKSTIITFALTIQDILNNPEITVGIFSHKRDMAKDFLQQIKREFESNEFLKALFPDILYQNPRSESTLWTNEAIIVKRKGNPKEATVEAWGIVEGQPTSRHFSLMVFDDVVSRESVSTPEQIEKTTRAWADSLNLSSAGGKIRYIGTRWATRDTYAEIIERGAAKPRIYPGVLPNGEPVYWDKETVKSKREKMGAHTFACQILLNPQAAIENTFDRSWIRFWDVDENGKYNLENLNIYIVVDPAGSKKRRRDYTAIVVFGVGEDEVYRIIDMEKDKLNLEERTNVVFDLVKRYRPIIVGYEKYGMQSDIEHIQYVQRKKNFMFNIVPLYSPLSKADRIAWLIAPFKQGRILLPRSIVKRNWEGLEIDVVQDFIDNEYSVYMPGLEMHDDMLDCMANMFHPDLGVTPPVSTASPFQLQREVINNYDPLDMQENFMWW